MGIHEPSIKEVAEAVINIRNSKIPSPKLIPNAGSFFKNPTISDEKFENLKEIYQDMPFYKLPVGYKIPAGWLWKKRTGEAIPQREWAVMKIRRSSL